MSRDDSVTGLNHRKLFGQQGETAGAQYVRRKG